MIPVFFENLFIYFTFNLTWCRDILVCFPFSTLRMISAVNIPTVPNSANPYALKLMLPMKKPPIYFYWFKVFFFFYGPSVLLWHYFHWLSSYFSCESVEIHKHLCSLYVFSICVFTSYEKVQLLFLYVFKFILWFFLKTWSPVH